jgi:hypothetical protein
VNRFFPFLAAVLVASSLFAQTEDERLLLPIFTSPVRGAFGSEFHTDLRLRNNGEHEVVLFGLSTPRCVPVCLPELFPFILGPNEELEPGDATLNGSPGRFVYVAKDELSSLSMNLRVHDVSRGALNFGTEIPIVRESEFRTDAITLLGVPTDERFRNTLRIYGESPVEVLVTIADQEPVRLKLVGGVSFPFPAIIDFPDLNTPAYVAYSNFPAGIVPVRVKVEANPSFLTLLPIETRLWAFITVTNNETQAITTITPQP